MTQPMTRDHEARSEMRPTPTSSSSSPFRGDLCCISACLFNMDVGVARSLTLGNQILPCVLGARVRPTSLSHDLRN